MARILGAVASSHTPTIGFALDTHKESDPARAPIFEAANADKLHQFGGAPTARRRADAANAVLNVLSDRQMGKQRRVLSDVTDAPILRRCKSADLGVEPLPAVVADVAAGWAKQTGDGA